MYGPINVKSPNDINKWQMGFNSAFRGLTLHNKRRSKFPSETKLPVDVQITVLYATETGSDSVSSGRKAGMRSCSFAFISDIVKNARSFTSGAQKPMSSSRGRTHILLPVNL
jgi:hypothetical protein